MARSSVGDDIANAGGGTPGSLPSGSLINTPTNKYHHIALTRESNTAKLFQNGKYIGSGTWDTNYTPTNLRLAHSIYSAGSAEYLTGFMQDVRLYDGIRCPYTGTTVNEQSFIVPSQPFPDILPDTPSGVSGGSKLTKITDGAVAFDGSGDSLVCADSADWDFGTGDFTIECFAYFNDTTSVNSTMINRWTDIWTFQIVSSSQNLRFYAGASDNLATASNTIGPNRWYHFAASRSSGTLKLFIDGVEGASSSFTKSLSGSVPL